MAFVPTPSLFPTSRRRFSNLRTPTPPPRSVQTPLCSLPRVRFQQLSPDSFRHPVDLRATRALQTLNVDQFLRPLLAFAENSYFLSNISSSVLVTPRQYPKLHQLLEEACVVLDLPPPQLYIRNHPIPNAYTLAIQGKRPFIVIHSALLDMLTAEEVQAVIAHELGHLKSEHGIWVTLANLILLLSSNIAGAPGRVLVETLSSNLSEWQRAAELTCDRAMLLVVQDKTVAMSALMKLVGGTAKWADEMDVDEFLKQADEFESASKSGFGRWWRTSMTRETTHPLPIARVVEINKWAQSNHFRSLLRNGTPLLPTKVGTE